MTAQEFRKCWKECLRLFLTQYKNSRIHEWEPIPTGWSTPKHIIVIKIERKIRNKTNGTKCNIDMEPHKATIKRQVDTLEQSSGSKVVVNERHNTTHNN